MKPCKNDENLLPKDVQFSEKVQSYPTFSSMNLRPELLHGILAYGFEKPSLIQQKTTKLIIDGRDVIGQAQSGTGKTAMFSIGTLQKIQPEFRHVQLLVLAPTRELALQIHQVICGLSDYLSIKCVACCGGRSNSSQMAQEINKGVHVVVGTPGRILDLIRQGSLSIKKLKSLVLDEADEMLNQGLRDQLKQIYDYLRRVDNCETERPKCQIIIVSATMPKEHLEIFENLTNDPVRVLVPKDELTLSAIQQYFIDVGSEEWKYESLNDLFSSICVSQTVVFVNTRRKVEWLNDRLHQDGFTVGAVHGELNQVQRELIMEQFRSGKCRILVSSDVWARGIDVQSVGLVINYDLPSNPSEYLHRIGRSGRFGRRGLAVTLICGSAEKKQLSTIADYYEVGIQPAPAQLSNMLLLPNDATTRTETDRPAKLSAKKKRRKKFKKKQFSV